jgi:hypothetical protein
MLEFKILSGSHNHIRIERLFKKFILIPSNFEYKKSFPKGEETYRKVIKLSFWWFLWNIEIWVKRTKRKNK